MKVVETIWPHRGQHMQVFFAFTLHFGDLCLHRCCYDASMLNVILTRVKYNSYISAKCEEFVYLRS